MSDDSIVTLEQIGERGTLVPDISEPIVRVEPWPEWLSEDDTVTVDVKGKRYRGVPVRYRDGGADFLLSHAAGSGG